MTQPDKLDTELGRQLADARKRYLDLMVRILTNTIYADPDVAPWGAPGFDARRRVSGQDWPQVAHTMIGIERLQSLRLMCEAVLKNGIPGDFIETGVWRGGACILMRAVLAAYGDGQRQVWCADSFEGLPPPDPARYPADEGDRHHEYRLLAVSEEIVRRNFASYGLLDDRVRFLKGYFEDTLPSLDAGPFALVRLDGDMYGSTIVAITALYDRLSPGGFLVVDDYALPGCRAAIDDFRRDRGIAAPMHKIDWTGVWWQKPL